MRKIQADEQHGRPSRAWLAAISLQDPFTASGEIGTRTEISGELVAAAGFGLLLVISGIGVATHLVRASLRRSRN